MAGTMDKIKAKVDNVLHKDKHSDPTGPHDSHAANSADPRVDSDRIGTAGNTSGAGGVGAGQYGSSTHTGTGIGSNTHSSGIGSTTHGHNDPTGPHGSHAVNKADPRVDSDRLGTAGNTAGAGGVGAGQYGSTTHGTTHGTTGLGSNTHSSGLGSNTHSSGLGSNTTHGTTHGDPSGPHSSKLANKLDPTVDTKSYGIADPTTGHYANTHGTTGSGLTGNHATHGTTGTGLTGSHNTHSTGTGLGHNTYNDPSGPHSSHAGNKIDPRVDSDRYGTAGNTAGAGGVGAGQYGSNTSSDLTGSHGTHNTGAGLTGTHGAHGVHGGTVGSGNSNTTAGPHNSDMLNKVDPRVDSDLDGSKTVGGNKTYQ